MAVFDITLFSNMLHRQVPLTAIIPVEDLEIPGFPKIDRSKPFRSLFLLHGFSGTHTDWLRGSRIEQLSMMHNIAVATQPGKHRDEVTCECGHFVSVLVSFSCEQK